MKLPLLGITLDERFLTHRLRSASSAGILTGILATLLFGWRLYIDKIWSWDLLIIASTFVIAKWAFMAWYRFTD
ncbi:MAG: hypothetical protein K8J08_06585 [Thermoanaerobaculia bacterium]|nr:hypothetical protein [Thermoanaerobaculia bacterium]